MSDEVHQECYTSKGDFGIILVDVEHVNTVYEKITQPELAEFYG